MTDDTRRIRIREQSPAKIDGMALSTARLVRYVNVSAARFGSVGRVTVTGEEIEGGPPTLTDDPDTFLVAPLVGGMSSGEKAVADRSDYRWSARTRPIAGQFPITLYVNVLCGSYYSHSPASGSLTVTLTLGGDVRTTTTVDGVASFVINELGLYQIHVDGGTEYNDGDGVAYFFSLDYNRIVSIYLRRKYTDVRVHTTGCCRMAGSFSISGSVNVSGSTDSGGDFFQAHVPISWPFEYSATASPADGGGLLQVTQTSWGPTATDTCLEMGFAFVFPPDDDHVCIGGKFPVSRVLSYSDDGGECVLEMDYASTAGGQWHGSYVASFPSYEWKTCPEGADPADPDSYSVMVPGTAQQSLVQIRVNIAGTCEGSLTVAVRREIPYRNGPFAPQGCDPGDLEFYCLQSPAVLVNGSYVLEGALGYSNGSATTSQSAAQFTAMVPYSWTPQCEAPQGASGTATITGT